jgi:hypothetical protein
MIWLNPVCDPVCVRRSADCGFFPFLQEKDYVLMLLQGYLIAHELDKYLPKGESFDYLSSFQQYLKAADAATKNDFAWP